MDLGLLNLNAMFGGMPFITEKRVSVSVAALEAATARVRQLPCTDYKCRNASPAWKGLCDRCVAVNALETLERKEVTT